MNDGTDDVSNNTEGEEEEEDESLLSPEAAVELLRAILDSQPTSASASARSSDASQLMRLKDDLLSAPKPQVSSYTGVN
jgi:hypothetical protein